MTALAPVGLTLLSLCALVVFMKTKLSQMGSFEEADESWEVPRVTQYAHAALRRALGLAENVLRKMKIINLQIDRHITDALEKIRQQS